jgi:hypothetical protein
MQRYKSLDEGVLRVVVKRKQIVAATAPSMRASVPTYPQGVPINCEHVESMQER